MYRNCRVAAVIPAYNEEKQIGKVVATMPELVDLIIVINDCSKDKTGDVVRELEKTTNGRVKLLEHAVNQGVGGAVSTGFKYARDNNFDIAVVMDGDGQMDPADLPHLLDPVATGVADYAKGNRFMTGEAYKVMPKVRFFGNASLSLLTKIASGYWHVADSQTGYRAIGKAALKAIDWDAGYKRYGQPNDVLVSLNIHGFRVADVPVKPLYGVGEVSTLKVRKVIFTIGWLLVKLFFKRLYQKYVIRDFHPLVFFYAFGLLLLLLNVPLALRLVLLTALEGSVPKVNLTLLVFSSLSAVQFILFAMWFDMEANKDLKPSRRA